MLNSYQRTRLLLICGAMVCFVIFWFAGAVFHIPYFRGYEASLLQMPSPTMDLIVVIVLVLGCTAIGTLIAGSVRFDAGLFVATLGLSALSMRGGPMGDVLRTAANRAGPPVVFFMLALELLFLYAVIGVAWSGLWLLRQRGWLL